MRKAKKDEFVVMASDGVWDVLSSEACGAFVRSQLASNGGDVVAAAEALLDHSLALGSCDNISAIVVVL